MNDDVDRLVEQARDEDLYAAMVRLRLRHVLDPAGKALAGSYKSPEHGAQRWGRMLDEATRVVVRDVVVGLADAVEQLQAENVRWMEVSDNHLLLHAETANERDEARARVAALEAGMRAHDDCRVCRELLDLVPSTGQGESA